ncbi:Rubrerythrin [Caldicellulosiruptor saccharolyticus DSM 8903]|uniref:Rubrerythrin n=1 Tax=Caldicellulosiruptor saccharolyticus (strain ATCC 43494 / DSM 8903 / Tp8T 6331) TaxID=351627 RepID=A4XGP8_CALS8|nr:rubrerythrin family protein [Caldicellulosiruptor saccharolyticus]ABP66083.1 Rubrerythrin [Caldicellulosiruptor saccharolyticus DSM 8903]
MAVNNEMTAGFLRAAYGGESMAHMRYILWGEIAQKEGFPNIARLFKAISYAEQVHANNHFRVLGERKGGHAVSADAIFGVGNTVENLQGAIDGELFEVNQMYDVYLNAAKYQNEKDAEKSFHFAIEAEKIHAQLFKAAQDSAKEGKDIEIKNVYICPVCGHTVLDEAPEYCPICGTKREMYKEF